MSPYFVTAIARIFELSRDIVNVCVDSRYRLHQLYHKISFILPFTLLIHVMMMADDQLPGDVTAYPLGRAQYCGYWRNL
jgi:hypothetical protein